MTTPKSAKPETGRRRTQEERSATTREKVIQAAIDCIVEEGLHNTTAARIAARSGVTWGAIAHQFGDKDSVFFAVVERNADIYQRHLAGSGGRQLCRARECADRCHLELHQRTRVLCLQ